MTEAVHPLEGVTENWSFGCRSQGHFSLPTKHKAEEDARGQGRPGQAVQGIEDVPTRMEPCNKEISLIYK